MSGEIKFTKMWCRALKAQFGNKIEIVPYVASTKGRKGACDRIVTHAWWMGWLEFKGVGTPLSGFQRTFIMSMNHVRPRSAFVLREGYIEDIGGVALVQDADDNTLFIASTPLGLMEWLRSGGRPEGEE